MKKALFTLLLAFTFLGMNAQTHITVTGIAIDTLKVFDASDTAHVISQGTLSGVSSSHVLSLLTTARYDTTAAGTGIPITITSTLHGPDSALYILDNPVSTSHGTILKRQLYRDSVVLQPVKVYDGSVNCTIQFSGIARNYVTHHILTTIDTCVFYDPNVGNNKPVRVIFGLSGEDVDNYYPPRDTILYASIVPRKLVTKNVAFKTRKQYDGTTEAPLISHGWFTNVLEDDTVYFTPSAFYEDKNAGTNKTIHTHFEIYGPDTMNYSAPDDGLITNGEITYIQLHAVGGEAEKTKPYDSTTYCQVTTPSQPVGMLQGETVFLNTMASYDTPDVGTNHTITFSYTIYGDAAMNYIAPADSVYCTDGVITGLPQGLDNTLNVTAVGPNPFLDYVLIASPADGDHHVRIYNVSGVMLRSESFSGNSTTIDLSSLASGLYIFVVDGQTAKLIKK